MDGLVLLVTLACVLSEAVTVALPTVLKVRLKLLLPLTNAALDGKAALASLEVMATVSLVFTTFQFTSTALTVTLKAVPAIWLVGVPVLPLAVPGAAVSPGTSNCNFANAPALMVIEGVVLAVLLPSVTSLAVTVALPAVLKVTLKLCVPAANALVDTVPLLSLEVRPTVSVTVLTRFQLASTAFTVTLKAVPAV